MKWSIRSTSGTTSAVVDVGTDARSTVFVCGHGAGGHMNDESQRAICQALQRRGLTVVRFNFFYSEKGARAPDRMPKVIECFSAVVERVRTELAPSTVILGGRSMGGRAASMMAAEGFTPCDALVLYAYPLHPAGVGVAQPEKLRDAHLPSIRVPVLCFNGTRDDLCAPALMKRALENVKTAWQQEWIEGADHSFHVTRASGTTDAAVLASVADKTLQFVRALRS